MIATLALALTAAASSAALVAARPPLPAGAPTARSFATADAAIEAALDEVGDRGGVVAFGELHQTVATAKIPSALRRFTADLLPVLAPRLSHLVIETWVTTGRCGQTEKTVTADVERTIERPATTESEIETLLRVAEEHRVAPRILSLSCADYETMRGLGGAGVDYDRTLRVTARALEVAIVRALGDRATPAGPPRLVAVYGGALHNDLAPEAGLEAYSFAPRILAATLGRYEEIDLVVPEYAASSAAVRAQPWWRAYRRARRPGATVLVRRAARSFVVVFPTQTTSSRR